MGFASNAEATIPTPNPVNNVDIDFIKFCMPRPVGGRGSIKLGLDPNVGR